MSRSDLDVIELGYRAASHKDDFKAFLMNASLAEAFSEAARRRRLYPQGVSPQAVIGPGFAAFRERMRRAGAIR